MKKLQGIRIYLYLTAEPFMLGYFHILHQTYNLNVRRKSLPCGLTIIRYNLNDKAHNYVIDCKLLALRQILRASKDFISFKTGLKLAI